MLPKTFSSLMAYWDTERVPCFISYVMAVGITRGTAKLPCEFRLSGIMTGARKRKTHLLMSTEYSQVSRTGLTTPKRLGILSHSPFPAPTWT